jgi:parallel beta-helix repeat protein
MRYESVILVVIILIGASGYWGAITQAQPPPIPTTLSISPPSFILAWGESLTLTATLRDENGEPLAGKTINWSATAGVLSSTSGTTDSSGQVTVVYTAPAGIGYISVTITASFAGDATYAASLGTSTGTVGQGRAPTYIYGDDNFTAANGIRYGSGTETDPYVIENWVINASTAPGIHIHNTTAYFIIRNCAVKNGDPGYHGIILENVRNGAIENVISQWNSGSILLEDSQNNRLENNVCTNDGDESIHLQNSQNNTILNNTVKNTYGYGILLENSDNNTISNNTVRESWAGVRLSMGSDNNTISGNTLENNDWGIYLRESSNNIISNNMVRNNFDGIHLTENSDNNTIDNNTVETPWGDGINIQQGSDNNTITNNTVENSWDGIEIWDSGNNVVSNNAVRNNRGDGIDLDWSNNNIISNNAVANNRWGGIEIWHSDNNTVSNNAVENNSAEGIYLYYSDNNILENNRIENVTEQGINIDVSHGNSIENNRIENAMEGIRVYGSENNTFENNLVENSWTGMWISQSKNIKLRGNLLENNRYSFAVLGNLIEDKIDYYIHDIDNSNLINGKPIIYLVGENNLTIDRDNQFGFVGLVRCENVAIENIFLENNWMGLLLMNVANIVIENNVYFRHNIFGIFADNLKNLEIRDSVLENNACGAFIFADNIVFENNYLKNNFIENDIWQNVAIPFEIPDLGVSMVVGGENGWLENNRFENSTIGLVLARAENFTLRNNSIDNSEALGFAVVGFEIENLETARLYAGGLANYIHDIDNSNLIDGKPIIYLVGENNLTINQDNVLGFLGLVNSENVTVENVTLDKGFVLLAGTKNSTIENISITVRRVIMGGLGVFIAAGSENNRVVNNYLENRWVGIFLDNSKNNMISNNYLDNNFVGILLNRSKNNTIVNNNYLGYNLVGILLYHSDSNQLSNNDVRNCLTGILLGYSDNNQLSNNYVKDCLTDIFFQQSENNTLITNTYSTSSGVPAISSITVSNITQSSATVTWTTAVSSDSVVEYGTTPGYGLTASDAAMVTSHSITLSGLYPSTTYYYRVKSTDGNNNTEISFGDTFTTSSPPPAKTDTILTVEPPSFSLTSGENIILTATLKDVDNNPLPNKTISWSVTGGELSATTGTTDENGQVRVTYTAPSVTEVENVTITASFAGDASYNASTTSITGVVSAAPLTSTKLSISPASFSLNPGDNRVLVATLVDEDGDPLAGKTINWSASAGEITPSIAITDNLGRAEATFIAPDVTTYTLVEITASFAGDATHAASNANATGEVIVPLPTTLVITPENFVTEPGGKVTLVATLLDNAGRSLEGRTVTWEASAGEVEPASGQTDLWGQISVTYLAPVTENLLEVVITASFAGELSHLPTSGSATGIVSPPAPVKTSLSIEPPGFFLSPGENLTLTAVLLDEAGAPLVGKPTIWGASAGELSANHVITNDLGEASVIYTAPLVDVHTPVAVSVLFLGDESYVASSALAAGTVLLPETKQALENVDDAAEEVGIELVHENLKIVRDALVREHLGLTLTITLEVPGREYFRHENVHVKRIDFKPMEFVEVEVESDVGRTVLLSIENEVLPLGWVWEVTVDNLPIQMADDYTDVLDPTDENVPEYLILKGGRGAQVLVSIPGFSARTIAVTATMPTVPTIGIPPVYLVVIALIVLVAVLLAIISRYLRVAEKIPSSPSPALEKPST